MGRDVNQITNIIADICELLNTENVSETGIQSFSFVLPVDSGAHWLEWLSAQSHYPQFYWQHRDGDEEVVACGQIRLFSKVTDAEAFLRQPHQFAQMRLWGLNAWDKVNFTPSQHENIIGGESYLFLPRLELRRHRGENRLYIHVDGQADLENARQFLKQLLPGQPLLPLQTAILKAKHTPESAQWHRLLEHALNAISQNKIEKVVIARKTELTLNSPLHTAQLMAASRSVNHGCYHFMLAFSAEHAFLASTPERLYYRNQLQFYTEALAGTVANAEDDQQAAELGQWLLEDEKNQHENLIVVDDICQRLRGGVVSVDVAPPDVIRLRKVQHLRRPIRGVLNHVCDSDCLRRLQPTAAVAGLPREAARQFLANHEPFKRDWYAGSAGYLGLEQSEFAVSLRCACIHDKVLALYAGAGIVAGSDPAQEWLEIENKAAGLRTLLTSMIDE
ncbi:isochorismate synthase (isochorismate hydroxymutase 2), menaquinone biosynthesis [Xenorhabdus doucetiae]|uniref:Isochorismate synthase MenF n=1 Tax=Xenorhabdus doucetiae TaxID=351671 RepID=A0A068QWS1_9GAMM|nr:isochorismate synthase (isochorismate hydroxymutase 2), menaquinone biosynthesis [Xenorhabdus doucetiae]